MLKQGNSCDKDCPLPRNSTPSEQKPKRTQPERPNQARGPIHAGGGGLATFFSSSSREESGAAAAYAAAHAREHAHHREREIRARVHAQTKMHAHTCTRCTPGLTHWLCCHLSEQVFLRLPRTPRSAPVFVNIQSNIVGLNCPTIMT